jgi:hypothetical protein
MPMSAAAAHRVKNVPRRKRAKRGSREHLRDAVMQDVFSRRGLASRIAEHLEISHQNVSAWKRVPAHYVLKLAPLLELSAEQIRPDIFGANKKRRKANDSMDT